MKVLPSLCRDNFITLALLFVSGGWTTNSGSDTVKLLILIAISLSLFFALYLPQEKHFYLPVAAFKSMLTISLIYFIIISLSNNINLHHIFILCKVVLGYLFTCYFLKNRLNLLELISDTLYKCAPLSILLHLIIVVTGGLPAFYIPSYLYGPSVSVEYYSIFFINYYNYKPMYGFTDWARNSFVFWEPGVLAFFINMGFFYELFIAKRKERLFTLFLFMLSTLSMGGLLIQTFLIGTRIVGSYFKEAFAFNVFYILLVFLAATGGYIFIENIALVTELIFGRNLLLDSSSSFRLREFYAPWLASLDKPFVGHGLEASDLVPYQDFYLSLYNAYANIITNSWSIIVYGLGYPALFLFSYYLYVTKAVTDHYRLVFFVLLMLLFSHEPLIFSPFSFALMTFQSKHIYESSKSCN